MSERKLPDKLIVKPWPLCVGSDEQEANRRAIEYNSLKLDDSRRETVYKKWEEAISRASWD